MSTLGPTPPRERLVTLDVLRGLALCGVMIGNMILYSGRFTDPFTGARPVPSLLDEIAGWLVSIFVSSKAQTLLTLLFGFAFAAQLLRADERGEPVMGVYVRRLLALFIFGALHVSLLWWGDVTWTYAVAGVGMLAFVRASNRTRVIAGLVFCFVPLLVWSIPAISAATMSVFIEPRELTAAMAHIGAVIRASTRDGLAAEHVHFALVWCTRIYSWYFLWTLGRFLLGYVAGQRRWFDRDGADHLPVFRRLALWGGAIALVSQIEFVLVRLQVFSPRDLGLAGRLGNTALHELGLLAQSAAYVGIVVLLMQRPRWRRVLSIIAPAGRMPLTTYFSQSVVCTFVFYGWGLGLAGRAGEAACLGIALAVFAVQVAIAHLWLRRFRFGPLEWLWRTAVYLRPQPMR